MVGGPAHPRAGGENVGCVHVLDGGRGSSPRGRGKHNLVIGHGSSERLIPARAGKTRRAPRGSCRRTAHPRAGGENVGGDPQELPNLGSSPRGRGKRFDWGVILSSMGLIPARAGKTVVADTKNFSRAAHPRAGGENLTPAGRLVIDGGSSPRGRGKLDPVDESLDEIRLIPARAGKTRVDNPAPSR